MQPFLSDVNGNWGPWGIGECSNSDCQGTLNKVRECNNPAKELDGMDCEENPTGAEETEDCNVDMGECPGKPAIISNVTEI